MPGILELILGLALIGLLVWVVITYIPMPDKFKSLIVTVAIVLVVVYLIATVFNVSWINLPVPRVR